MFCVIQKIQRKQADKYGAAKRIELVEKEEMNYYGYRYSTERFERPILDAYKISLHHSYREAGKVKKKQWSVTTMGYYDIAIYGVSDCVTSSKIDDIAAASNVPTETIWEMIHSKIEPLQNEIIEEFRRSEEYLIDKQNRELEAAYLKRRDTFDSVYGYGEYSRCYDFYGTLRNTEYLEQLKSKKAQADDYQKRSEQAQREYQEHGHYQQSSYHTLSPSNYEENERAWLKEIYRMASKKFHPDAPGGSEEKMKFLTKLKERWGV